MHAARNRFAGLLIAVALALAFFCPIGRAFQDQATEDVTTRGAGNELKRLHALLVIDTNSNLRESVSVDGERIELLLKHTIPSSRLSLKVLSGNDVSEKNILQYYRSLATSSSDALLFFYAGHGATDPEKGHYLAFNAGKSGQILRSTLRQAMRDKHAGLAVIWSDCCSNRVALPKTTKRPAKPAPTTLNPVVRNLLFQHRGIVDVTGSTEASFGDDDNGGIFTRTLAGLMQGDIKQLDKNHDNFVSWQEFYPLLEEETDQTFKRWAKQMRSRGESIDQSAQRPRKFELAEPLLEAGKEIAQAVIGLRNAGTIPLAYQFRWAGEKSWTKASLDAGKTATHATRVADANTNPPAFEVQFEGEKDLMTLQSKVWVGQGSPSYAVARKYKIESDNKTRKAEPLKADTDKR